MLSIHAWMPMDSIGQQPKAIAAQPGLPILQRARRLFTSKMTVKNQGIFCSLREEH
jgi:hypothetical protein